MKTQCKSEALLSQTESKRELVAHFDGGNIYSDAGGLLLQQTERITGIIKRFTVCLRIFGIRRSKAGAVLVASWARPNILQRARTKI